MRAHLQGYVSARARIVQITSSAGDVTLALTRVQDAADRPRILQAGIAGDTGDDTEPDDAGERLRVVVDDDAVELSGRQ
ncbi:MAG: hypothetical protein DMF88_00950 [Acidobacteria bacterium]|nr:MAG: hypothetical protein DMF88_00950 [Acidobacteriota bacterium]